MDQNGDLTEITYRVQVKKDGGFDLSGRATLIKACIRNISLRKFAVTCATYSIYKINILSLNRPVN